MNLFPYSEFSPAIKAEKASSEIKKKKMGFNQNSNSTGKKMLEFSVVQRLAETSIASSSSAREKIPTGS